MSRSRIALLSALTIWMAALPASAAPPIFGGLGQYRIVDASGRITPRAASDASGRVVMRPATPPPLMLRAKPYFLSGYAGAAYGPRNPGYPATYHEATGRRFAHFWHGH